MKTTVDETLVEMAYAELRRARAYGLWEDAAPHINKAEQLLRDALPETRREAVDGTVAQEEAARRAEWAAERARLMGTAGRKRAKR